MNATELLKHQYDLGFSWLTGMVRDMSDEEMLTPPVPGGNFPLWNVGHLAWAEARGLHERILEDENPLAGWAEKFGQGSTPAPGGEGYPSRDDLWSAFERGRRDLVAYIDSLREADMDKPTALDHPRFNTVGKLLGTMACHQLFHIGQVADTRKLFGKTRVLA